MQAVSHREAHFRSSVLRRTGEREKQTQDLPNLLLLLLMLDLKLHHWLVLAWLLLLVVSLQQL